MQLMALAFCHPTEEFHRLLQDGSYARALTTSVDAAVGARNTMPAQPQRFEDFESGYIELFQMGRRGKPLVSLNAGDHDTLNTEASRPEFLLQYADWYRHFGLKTDEQEDANQLPDHLVCQLEFLSWLAHLEDTASEDAGLRLGYRMAQRDFIQRHLLPFLDILVKQLQHNSDVAGADFFHACAELCLRSAGTALAQLETGPDGLNEAATQSDSNTINSVNLWG
jgi:DMSO reductase family type II enzyme chaperone